MEDLITSYAPRIIEAGCAPGSGLYGLQVDIREDISPVFPYVNALLSETRYDHQNCILIWREEQYSFALRPHQIKIIQNQGIDEPNQAHELVDKTVERLNRIWHDRQRITPCFNEKARPSVVEIYNLLPKTNCKLCGYVTCLVYAAELRDGKAELEYCIPLKTGYADSKRKLLGFLPPT